MPYTIDTTTMPGVLWLRLWGSIKPAEMESFLAEHNAAIQWVVDNLSGGGEPCPADLDGNGDVGASDLATLLAAWGTAGADLGGDGFTDAADLAALLASWGACP